MIQKVGVEKNEIAIQTDEGVFKKRFYCGIAKYLIYENKIFIRLELVGKDKNNQNIFCLNENAEILWQIQDPDSLLLPMRKTDSVFTDIKIKNNKLIANNWNDGIYEVDMNTGKIKYIGWTK